MDCSPPDSSVQEIFQARILEWVAISFSRGPSQPRDQTRVSCTVGRFYADWATRDAQKHVPPNAGPEPKTLRLRVTCSTDWDSRALLFVWNAQIGKSIEAKHGCQRLGVTAYWAEFPSDWRKCLGTRQRWQLHNILNVLNAPNLFILKRVNLVNFMLHVFYLN